MHGLLRKVGVGLALLLAAAVVTTVLPGSPASAEPGAVSCPAGSSVIHYDPPLTNVLEETTITIHRELGACTSSTHPRITTGTVDSVSTVPASCSRPLVGSSLSSTIVWNTGETSTLSLNAVSSVVLGQLVTTFTGSVTDGLFDGSTITWVQASPSEGLILCNTTGLETQYATLTTQITSTA